MALHQQHTFDEHPHYSSVEDPNDLLGPSNKIINELKEKGEVEVSKDRDGNEIRTHLGEGGKPRVVESSVDGRIATRAIHNADGSIQTFALNKEGKPYRVSHARADGTLESSHELDNDGNLTRASFYGPGGYGNQIGETLYEDGKPVADHHFENGNFVGTFKYGDDHVGVPKDGGPQGAYL